MLFNRDPDVIVYRNVGLLSLSAVEMFAQIAEDAISERQRLLVALSGGSTPKLLFSHVKIPYENLHRIRGEAAPAQAAEEYRHHLERFSEGNLKWPRFDLAFLGLGADGHTASLFPGAITLEEKVSPVLAVTADYQGCPAGRVTLTPLTLNSARNLIFMVCGKDKAHAVFETLNGSIDLEKWPAQRIQLVDGKITWLLDEAAASR
jgi:6-phosphogluconolactonase